MLPCLEGPANPLLKTLSSYPKGQTSSSPKPRKAILYLSSSLIVIEDSRLLPLDRTELLYYINKTTDNLWLYILLEMVFNIFQIAYEKRHPSFSCCYKIVIYS